MCLLSADRAVFQPEPQYNAPHALWLQGRSSVAARIRGRGTFGRRLRRRLHLRLLHGLTPAAAPAARAAHGSHPAPFASPCEWRRANYRSVRCANAGAQDRAAYNHQRVVPVANAIVHRSVCKILRRARRPSAEWVTKPMSFRTCREDTGDLLESGTRTRDRQAAFFTPNTRCRVAGTSIFGPVRGRQGQGPTCSRALRRPRSPW